MMSLNSFAMYLGLTIGSNFGGILFQNLNSMSLGHLSALSYGLVMLRISRQKKENHSLDDFSVELLS
ncbi:hypothetical protein [Lactococcus fujiensis]|uniref:hypothetical protein n=2 Tax=Lactococcus fujiensis TaxID=610251 RepID=UPI00117A4198|nr:hypothetical protein [Lactococcus fujiensis]